MVSDIETHMDDSVVLRLQQQWKKAIEKNTLVSFSNIQGFLYGLSCPEFVNKEALREFIFLMDINAIKLMDAKLS